MLGAQIRGLPTRVVSVKSIHLTQCHDLRGEVEVTQGQTAIFSAIIALIGVTLSVVTTLRINYLQRREERRKLEVRTLCGSPR